MRTLGKCLFALVVLAALWATVEAVRVRGVRTEDREAVRVGLAGVVKRVQDTTDNLALVKGINNGMAMSKVRAFARIVANAAFVGMRGTVADTCCQSASVPLTPTGYSPAIHFPFSSHQSSPIDAPCPLASSPSQRTQPSIL